jgi:hypothetical protein
VPAKWAAVRYADAVQCPAEGQNENLVIYGLSCHNGLHGSADHASFTDICSFGQPGEDYKYQRLVILRWNKTEARKSKPPRLLPP